MAKTFVKDGGVWKEVQRLWVRSGGVWRETITGYVKDEGIHKIFFQSYAEIQFLLAGGGGGGSGVRDSVSATSGGGAGGLIIDKFQAQRGALYSITIGNGGGAGSDIRNGGDGQPSTIVGSTGSTPIILSYTALGGGGGGGGANNGRPGGSGGGGSGYRFGVTLGGDAIPGPDGKLQGHRGGDGRANGGSNGYGGSGGGAGGPGINSYYGFYPPGGPGIQSAISGIPLIYSAGGNAGGGNAANGFNGGGGANSGCGMGFRQAGFSGVAILRLPTSKYTGIVTGAVTVTRVGTDTVLRFTGAGTYQA